MSWSRFLRTSHRWMSVVFTLCFLANIFTIVVLGMEQPPLWVTFSPLAPLFWLLGSGLYLFALPYLATPRSQE